MSRGAALHGSRLRGPLGSGISISTLILAHAAFAQTGQAPAATPAQAMGDIVVTAQFREQKLQDTPIAITAVNAALLEARSQTNIAEVTNQAPNVTLKPQGGSWGASIAANIRGVGQADFDPAFEPGVGLYIDDVYYPQLTGSLLDLLDLDRVEILRGPQGTLAGKNSIGGAIKLYSKKPTGENSGYVEATGGSRDRVGVRVGVDFKINQDWSARLSGVFKQQDGYVDRIDYGCAHPGSGIPAVAAAGHCTLAELGGVGYKAVRGILRYAPQRDFELNLIADYTKDVHTMAGEVLVHAGLDNPNTNPAPGVPYDSRFICGKYCNYATVGQPAATWQGFLAGFPLVATHGSDLVRFDGWGASAQMRIGLNQSMSLSSITAYRGFVSSFDSDDDLSPANINFGRDKLNHWSVSQEVRLNGKIGKTIDYTLGGFYFDEKTRYWTFQDIRYVVIPLQFIGNDPVTADTEAAFANANWEALPGLNFSAGLRYTNESKDYRYARLAPGGTPNLFLGALNGAVGHYSGDNVDYRVNVDYRFSPALLAYANIATGIKGGGVNPRPFNVAQARGFNPEKLTNYEIGIKSDLFDRRMRLNISAFYSDYKDIQIPLLSCPQFGGPGPCALPANAGDGHFKGVEAELFAKPIPGLTIDGSVSYLEFHYTRIDPQAGGPSNPTGPQLNDPFAGAPKWKWSLGVQYEIMLGDKLGSLTPRFDVAYQDPIFTGHDPGATPAVVGAEQFLPAFTLANARLTWKNPGHDLEASLEVTNLFDKYYYLTNFDLRGAGAGFEKAQPGRPREWAITVKKKF